MPEPAGRGLGRLRVLLAARTAGKGELVVDVPVELTVQPAPARG